MSQYILFYFYLMSNGVTVRGANGLVPGRNHGGSRPVSIFIDLDMDLTWKLRVVS